MLASVLLGWAFLASPWPEPEPEPEARALEAWQPGWRLPNAQIHLPLRATARPTTVPADHFEVRFIGGATRSFDGQWRGPLGAGASYGLTDQVEVGLELLRLTLGPESEPNAGLFAPTVFARGRLVAGPLEAGAEAELELPLEGFRAFNVGLFTRTHAGPFARLDVSFRLGGIFEEGNRWPAELPIEALFSPFERVSFGGGLRLASDDLFRGPDVRMHPLGVLRVVLGQRTSAPLVEFEARFEGPATTLREDRPGDDLLISLGVLLFFDDPTNGQDEWKL